MTLTKYSISAHLGAPRRGLRGDVMVTCHGTKTRHGNTAKSHINVMVFPYRRERVEECEAKIRSVEVQLIRVETIQVRLLFVSKNHYIEDVSPSE